MIGLLFSVFSTGIAIVALYSSSEIEKVYYLLDWESVSKSRIATTDGFNKVNNSLKMLLTNMDLMEHVNTLLGKKNLLTFEIIEYVNNMDNVTKNEFLEYFKEWIKELRNSRNLDPLNLPNDIESLIKIFRSSIDESVDDKAPNSRIEQAVRNLGIAYFLKTRGRYGYMLNMNQELLILITSMCIKEDKIKISKLFEEYERRGVFFDRESRDLIIELFNNLNLIDKKSDSGEVQYVKSIL